MTPDPKMIFRCQCIDFITENIFVGGGGGERVLRFSSLSLFLKIVSQAVTVFLVVRFSISHLHTGLIGLEFGV